ncbi:MAG: sugar ABC transporter permease [Anaerolineaceae bacterium]|nr:sugar ABC transporter permease [Anaerolineaceae bacterium]MDE0327692.1 sugar ABC transporter permease [Anaerolineaceae bacterium]MDE0608384.1 sugar ABC transporter permease [Anaerolineaceae bacterium]
MTALTAKSLDLSRVRRRRLSGLLPKSRLALLVIVIVFIFYGIMLWYPILDQFDMAFHRGLTLRRVPVGGMQFQRVLQDRAFNNAIGVTLRYVLMVVPATTILGLLLAAVINSFKNIATRTVLVSLFFLPHIVPLAAAATFWKTLLAPTSNGVLNGILHVFGLPTSRWLLSAETSLLSLALVAVWGGIGYAMLLLLAGMQTIPDMFYEAAAIDGASAWQRLRKITVPLLMPSIAFVVVILTFGGLMMFEPVYIMTGGQVSHEDKGGPAGSTSTVIWLIYQQGFQNFKQGYAAAVAVIWFFVMLALGLIQFWFFSRRRVSY